MSIQSVIESKLNDKMNTSVLKIENESQMHSGPATDSHFKITIVSDDFDGMMLLARHRMINEILKEELSGTIHALTMYTMTTSEYDKKQGVTGSSPACQGGDKGC